MSQLEVYLTIDRGLVTVEGGLGVKVVALGAWDPAGEEGVSTVGQLVTPALIAPDTLSCDTTVSTRPPSSCLTSLNENCDQQQKEESGGIS